ncbi:MAG: hypothetical protein J0L92_38875, partial [Deltaproteobacteria bacterium]|nr:hypothetical protein [Deltaproteobacteria bacterium]
MRAYPWHALPRVTREHARSTGALADLVDVNALSVARETLGSLLDVEVAVAAGPAGAVSATMKSLAEVEPRTAINSTNTPGDANSVYRISQPGSYYLTGNVQGALGKSGIQITSSNVTLDLNGFSLEGVAGA